MNKKRTLPLFFVAVSLFIASGSLFAHHSPSEQDRTRVVTLHGVVTKWELINPHGLLYFEVKNESGTVEQWMGTGGAPNHMMREGWTGKTLKPGDQVTVIGHPYKDGRKLMYFTDVVLPNGKKQKCC
jgi:hypothetical protein